MCVFVSSAQVIVEKVNGAWIPELEKKKNLVPGDLTGIHCHSFSVAITIPSPSVCAVGWMVGEY